MEGGQGQLRVGWGLAGGTHLGQLAHFLAAPSESECALHCRSPVWPAGALPVEGLGKASGGAGGD